MLHIDKNMKLYCVSFDENKHIQGKRWTKGQMYSVGSDEENAINRVKEHHETLKDSVTCGNYFAAEIREVMNYKILLDKQN